jgi:hypothetical protein
VRQVENDKSAGFQNIIEQLRTDAGPVALMRSLVIQSGGQWADHIEDTLFEIHFMGTAGTGIGAHEAVKSWMKHAERQIGIDTAASDFYTPSMQV